jgi:hypothetical protein
MVATYASVLAVCTASLAIGQATISVCGRRRWSWLAPAVGLALVCALSWATVRMPGDGVVSALAVAVATALAALYLRRRLEGGAEALRAGWPVALGGLLAASLPFFVEGRFGILGTGFNPDMSQHLLAADRLADGVGSPLLVEGYPLGPHAIVVALEKGLGIGIVQGFSGLTVATTILASLTALGALSEYSPARRTVGALLVGLPYMIASYLAQGAFKETMLALFILAFAIGLHELARNGARSPLRAVPLGLVAAGAVYVYSFAGLVWLIGSAVLWGAFEVLRRRAPMRAWLRPAARPALLALLVFAVLIAPEIGRMLDFRRFETFDPGGPGLGNLFGQISPFEALGIWPSGDFRLTPGDGAVPAIGYYAGVALALALLALGLAWSLRRGETALPAALVAALAIYAAARIGGTPYTAAKAVAMAAPLAMLAIVRPVMALPSSWPEPAPGGWLAPLAAAGFVFAAAGCSLLALANAPVGPTSYSAGLATLRSEVGSGPTLILESRELIEDQHGSDYLNWELRGGRVCIGAEGEAGDLPLDSVRFVIRDRHRLGARFEGFRRVRTAGAYALFESQAGETGAADCPLIAVRQARQGEARE